MAIVRPEVADLPEVVAQAEGGALRQVVALLPVLRRIADLEGDVLVQVGHPGAGQAAQDGRASTAPQAIPVLCDLGIEVADRDKDQQAIAAGRRGGRIGAGRRMDVEAGLVRQLAVLEDAIEAGAVIPARKTL